MQPNSQFGIADVVKITNMKAIYPIDEFEKMDQSILELLDWEKDFLYKVG